MPSLVAEAQWISVHGTWGWFPIRGVLRGLLRTEQICEYSAQTTNFLQSWHLFFLWFHSHPLDLLTLPMCPLQRLPEPCTTHF